MQTWIRGGWMRCSATFCVSVALMLAALFSWTQPVTTATNNTTTKVSTDDKSRADDHKQASLSRWIEIDLSKQRLYAWTGKKLVYSFRVSTGKRGTPTPTGKFAIDSKYRTNRMRGRGYNIPDVPYAMYFYEGYAIHGAYWHNNFGTPVSHGCVNLPVKQARKLYHWASQGTLVVVHK